MDALDRKILNALQKGFPLSERPYAEAAAQLGIDETVLLQRVQKLLDDKTLTRFGPMYDVERLGGAFSLAAMRVKDEDFERVAATVNRFPEVAHNYQREHEFNMWFVLATDDPMQIDSVKVEIEKHTGYPVYNMPKLKEFYIGLHFDV